MKKILSILCIIVVLIAFAGWFAYNKWKTSPSYSLMQTGIALQTKNTMMLEKYVDLDNLLDKAITSALTEAMKANNQNSENEMAGMFAMGLVSAFKPQIVSMAKEAILSGMQEAGEAPAQAGGKCSLNGEQCSTKENTADNAEKAPFKKPAIKSVKILSQDDDLASAEIIIKAEEVEEPIRLVFGMRQHGNYWRIEELQNTKELVEKASALLAEEEGLGNMMDANPLASFGSMSDDVKVSYEVSDIEDFEGTMPEDLKTTSGNSAPQTAPAI